MNDIAKAAGLGENWRAQLSSMRAGAAQRAHDQPVSKLLGGPPYEVRIARALKWESMINVASFRFFRLLTPSPPRPGPSRPPRRR